MYITNIADEYDNITVTNCTDICTPTLLLAIPCVK